MGPNNAGAPLYGVEPFIREFIPGPSKLPRAHPAQESHQLCVVTPFLALPYHSLGLIPWTQLRGNL